MVLRSMLVAALVLALLAGCESDKRREPKPALSAPVALEVVGPWASPDTTVEVSPDGAGVASRGRENPVRFELAPSEVAELDEIASAAFAEPRGRFRMACLDCFIYKLSLGEQGRVLDQVKLDASPRERELVALLGSHVPGGVTP